MAEYCCPIWGNTLETNPKHVNGVWFVYSPRAGGVYRLTGEWSRRGLSWTLNHLRKDPCRQKANLSHWIYHQNLKAGLLRPPEATLESRHDVLDWGWEANRLAAAPCLDPETVKAQYARIPSALERRLTLLNELLLQQDLPQPPDETKLHQVCRDYEGFRAAAAATTSAAEELEFRKHIEAKGWAIFPSQHSHRTPQGKFIYPPATCTLERASVGGRATTGAQQGPTGVRGHVV